VISFVQEHIIHRFRIAQTLTTDQGASFLLHQFKEFVTSLKIKALNSSPYYAQANGQAEPSNKTLLKIIKKKIDDNPRKWHEVLSEALWAHKMSRHGATRVTPFELVYRQEVVLTKEINLQSCRIVKQDMLSADEYTEGMMKGVDGVPESWLQALQEIDKEKLRVAKVYNRKVREKSFQIEELVRKTILPLGSKDRKLGKWPPSWEGPFRIVAIVLGNSYFIKTLEGKGVEKAINGRYLKKYFPSVSQSA
jgi:transposase InsO family protein